MGLNTELKDRLRILMQFHGYTRQQVSDITDCSMVTVHKWLSGGDMKDSRAMMLAEAFMCDWLFLKFGQTRLELDDAIKIASSVDTFEIGNLTTGSCVQIGRTASERLFHNQEDLIGDSFDKTLYCKKWGSKAVIDILRGGRDHAAPISAGGELIPVHHRLVTVSTIKTGESFLMLDVGSWMDSVYPPLGDV